MRMDREEQEKQEEKLGKTPYEAYLEDIQNNGLHVDPSAIPRMVDIIDLLKARNGLLGSVFDWMNEKLPSTS